MAVSKDAASAALDRAEAAGRRAAQAWTKSRGRPGGLQDQLWDPRGSSERLGKYLVAAHELRGTGASLTKRRSAAHDDYIASMDRQLAEVEHTRAMIAAACGGDLPWRTGSDSASGSGAGTSKSKLAPSATHATGKRAAAKVQARRATSVAAAAALSSQRTTPVSPNEVLPDRGSDGSVAPAWRRLQRPVVVQLCPVPCPAELLGQECPCCLVQMKSDDQVLAFPCPTGHSFHAACLEGWLKAAGSKTTCPLCRSWPQGKAV
mmetsp:Transcript_58325/g.103638  ORF Transcript_58325/g.103638 Transcript_58325/m.103638 type:complete len:262 (-) Transcript_58325:296-1081(-)